MLANEHQLDSCSFRLEHLLNSVFNKGDGCLLLSPLSPNPTLLSPPISVRRWRISTAVFMHHFSIREIYAILLLTDMVLRLAGLSINHGSQSVWQTAAPFMSLTFSAGYWISKHTVVCIFCSRTTIKLYTQPSAPMTQPIRYNKAL